MEFQIGIDIDAPAAVVWSVMSDVERWPEWTSSVRHVRRWQRERPFAVGSRALVRQPGLPPAIWTVTSLTPGREFIWKAGLPGWWSVGGHRVDPIGDVPASDSVSSLANGGQTGGANSGQELDTRRSHAVLTLAFEGLFGRAFAPRLRGLVEDYVTREAHGLKRQSEALARRP